MNKRRLFCFGHRGARGHEPENTLRSIRKALDLGADGIEVDVYFVDGHLIVIHDDTLDRTTNGKGPVAAKNFRHLRSLDAGRGEKIPTLAEVFHTVRRRAVINVELKGPGTAAPVAALIRQYVRRRGWRHRDFIVSSFDWPQLREFHMLCPKIRIGLLTDRIPADLFQVARELQAWSIHPAARQVTRAWVRKAHRRGLKVFPYTVNPAHRIAAMEKMGVDGIFTDFPERMVHST